jgi:hypothetical protein
MRWFNKGKPKVIQWPIDDFEPARRIRDVCNSSLGSAERVGGEVGGAETVASIYETMRYKRVAKAAMEIAIKISDDLLRDAALYQIVVLCVKASELRTAAILFWAIQAASIKEDMLINYPALRQAVI